MKIQKILLIRTYTPVTHFSLCPPLGLMYLASSLRNASNEERTIRILDMRLECMTLRAARAVIEEFGPDMIGISSLSHEASTLHDIAKIAKLIDRNCHVVAGGPHASAFFDRTLEDQNVEWVVVGEGEQTFVGLIDKIEQGENPASLWGVASRNPNGEILFQPRSYVENLDRLPFPSWDLIDLDAYSRRPNMNSMLKGKRYMAILTSRGCPYGCAYCHNLFGRGFRARSPENVYREMEVLQNEFGVDEFHIVDDIFNLDKQRAHAICDLMIQNRMKVHFAFPNGLRGDIIDQDLIHKMMRAGCYSMTYAIETASPRLQKLLRKNMNLKRLEQAIDASYRAGAVTKGFFMLGFPTETSEEIHETISFATRSKLLLAGFFCAVPFPRTALFDLARNEDPDFSLSPEDCFYYTQVPSYTRRTGIDLKALQRKANREFYLKAWRLKNLVMRIPRKRDLFRNLKPFVQLAFGRLLPLRNLKRPDT